MAEDILPQSPYFALAPNGLELTGDGSEAVGVRCSDLLGGLLLFERFMSRHSGWLADQQKFLR